MFTQRYLNSEMKRVRKMLIFDILLCLINLTAIAICCYGMQQQRYLSAGLIMIIALCSSKVNVSSFQTTWSTWRALRLELARLAEPEPRVRTPKVNVVFYGEKSN